MSVQICASMQVGGPGFTLILVSRGLILIAGGSKKVAEPWDSPKAEVPGSWHWVPGPGGKGPSEWSPRSDGVDWWRSLLAWELSLGPGLGDWH